MYGINLPGYIDNTNFKYLNIDEKIVMSILIQDYPKYIEFLQIIESIPKNINFDMSMYIKKQDTGKVLKDLTYKISSSSAEIKTINKNQIDIDLINNLKNDAIDLRKDIQINNQEIFNIVITITFFSNNFKELIYNIKSFQSILYSKGLISNLTNFRHLDSYILSLPINKNISSINKLNERCFTTDSLSMNFPFYIKNVFDIKGVMFGLVGAENKICNIDIFNSKYLNSNMCVFGSSGSGKSYFTKLLIIRHYLVGRRQYIFDLEGEYINLLKNIGFKCINFNNETTNILNIFEINNYEINNNNWFEKKVTKVFDFIISFFDKYSEEDINEIKEAIIKTYNNYGINEDKNTIFEKSSDKAIYVDNKIIDSKKFPTILDLLQNIKSKSIAQLIKNKIIKKYKCICGHSNFILSDKIVGFDTRNLNDKELVIFTKYFLNEIKEIALYDKCKTIIYIDEIWRYISAKNDNNFALIVSEYFKTLRKYNCSIVGITQDITDFFSYENGNYGKVILNNCGFKLFFRLEYADRKILENLNTIDEYQISKIYKLEKGQALLNFCNNKVIINIESSEYEEKLMEV